MKHATWHTCSTLCMLALDAYYHHLLTVRYVTSDESFSYI